MLFSHFSTFRAKLLTKTEMSKIELVAEFLGGPGGCQITLPDNIFSKFTHSGRRDGCRKELSDPLENPTLLHMNTAGEFQYIFIKITLKSMIFKK